MALTPEEIKKVNEEFNQLVNRLDELDKKAFSRVRQDLEAGKITLEEWNRQVTVFSKYLDTVSNNLSFAAEAFRNITRELRGGNAATQDRIKSLNKISNIARAALEVRRGENTLTQQQLQNLALKNKREEDILRSLYQEAEFGSERKQQLREELAATIGVGKSIGEIQNKQKEVNKELGFAPKIAAGLDKALQKAGLPALGIADALEETQKAAQKVADEGEEAEKSFSALGTFSKKFAVNLKESASATNITQLAIGAILSRVLEINKVQTEFVRLTGESATNFNALNTSLISTTDQLTTLVGLTDQFGLNANAAFDSINIQEASELRELLGLSAEEANNLAFFAQASGGNLKEAAANVFEGGNGLVSQKKILQDIGKVTPSIAMSFRGNVKALGDAANQAKLLGLSLQQVDNIAEGLLDIESSLASEFEAEVITGKQLNLERARFFALTNDIEGVTREIANNQEVLDTFATGTRIEQEAIAKSLNMSRDDMSKMLFEQQIIAGATAQEAAARTGMNIEDAKRLTIQQSINKSIEKMTELLAGPVEAFASLLSNAVVLKGLMVAIGVVTTMSFAKSLGSALVAFVGMIPKAAALLGIETGRAIAALTSASALTLGLGAIGILAAVAAGTALIKSMIGSAKDANDLMSLGSSGYGSRTLLAPEGAFALNNKDTVVAGTSLMGERGNRQTPGTVQIDYDRLADAIARGAEKGTSKANLTVNLDGDKVSSRLQTPTVLNTLPGV